MESQNTHAKATAGAGLSYSHFLSSPSVSSGLGAWGKNQARRKMEYEQSKSSSRRTQAGSKKPMRLPAYHPMDQMFALLKRLEIIVAQLNSILKQKSKYRVSASARSAIGRLGNIVSELTCILEEESKYGARESGGNGK
ncbi:MAG: hypothetical protein PHC53_02550 [Patescibacteria group bacterium]|nr:hypothetical protein [Patescibacteria group bacterium]